MRKVSTDYITPGCIVAADVVGPSGNVLVGKGLPISPALGRRLRNWGVAFVYVEGEDDADQSVKAAAEPPTKIKSDLYDMFYGTLDNARMKKILNAVCEHKLKKQDGV